MTTAPGMAHMPLQATRRSLLSIATGLRADSNTGTIDVLELSIGNVCRNAIAMLRAASPVLERLLTTIGPFAVLGFGVYKWIYMGMETKDYMYMKFMVNITVPGGTALNAQVVDYMADHSSTTNTRSMTVLENRFTIASNIFARHRPLMYVPKRATDGWFRFESSWLKFSQTLQAVEEDGEDDEGYRRRR